MQACEYLLSMKKNEEKRKPGTNKKRKDNIPILFNTESTEK